MFSDHHIDALNYAMERVKMGCDIHWYSETKKDGTWVCDQEVRKDSDYEYAELELENFPGGQSDYWFFGLLQKVRTDWDWAFPQRLHLPGDMSEEVDAAAQQWVYDAHSHGFRTRAELKDKLEELKHLRAIHLIDPSEETEGLHWHIKRLEETIANLSADVPDADQRIVFWFDN